MKTVYWAVKGCRTNLLKERIVMDNESQYLIFDTKERAISACEYEIGERVIKVKITELK